ncbi:hypothetical protein [Streptosporangium roseum]|uniref:AMOT angiomotin n=1 Tax=Streptosporangium roseum (strain ATCC 12428 / DSM 43021 / JCM 3005 / KCTC 9067 / NCIMB 10171 / NRRL 2505 / NI 9100) TaxID=479432 RepID=D2BFB2_STRRD|nr:hypothetical protein [Streptosporangium roseum]ACZ88270.1 AMOT; angiomotin [Streptosporangium roseum DSM 43021]
MPQCYADMSWLKRPGAVLVRGGSVACAVVRPAAAGPVISPMRTPGTAGEAAAGTVEAAVEGLPVGPEPAPVPEPVTALAQVVCRPA